VGCVLGFLLGSVPGFLLGFLLGPVPGFMLGPVPGFMLGPVPGSNSPASSVAGWFARRMVSSTRSDSDHGVVAVG
jgi:hypothetical protein